MGLFDGQIPMGVQQMLMQLVKSAAPDLSKNVEDLGAIVVAFKAQLDRIEAKLDSLNSAHQLEQSHDGRNGEPTDDISFHDGE